MTRAGPFIRAAALAPSILQLFFVRGRTNGRVSRIIDNANGTPEMVEFAFLTGARQCYRSI